MTVKNELGSAIGSTLLLALKAWSSELLVDVFAKVGAPGLVVDGARVEIEPVANKSRPAMVSSCQVVDLGNPATLDTTLSVGRVYEPLDLLRQRRVDVNSTPGWGTFEFTPGQAPAAATRSSCARRTWSNAGSATTGSCSP